MSQRRKKRWLVDMTMEMQPWARALLHIMEHAHAKKLSQLIRHGEPDGIKTFDVTNESIVYARISLDANDMYIGETGNLGERTIGHYMKCLKHEQKCRVNPCTKCDEHVKYILPTVCRCIVMDECSNLASRLPIPPSTWISHVCWICSWSFSCNCGRGYPAE